MGIADAGRLTGREMVIDGGIGLMVVTTLRQIPSSIHEFALPRSRALTISMNSVAFAGRKRAAGYTA